MLTLGGIDTLERQLKAAIVARNKRGDAGVTIIEAIDEAALWPEPFDSLAPLAPNVSIEQIGSRAPGFICAVAAEIGFRFEGVGTVFWAKFSDALGLSITMAHRQRIAETFEAQAARYSLSRPSESAFSSHFSIIAWPIANALLPVDLVGPVSRLMARAPIAALPGPGHSINFPSLRAWASAAEGARLADWLRFEAPTTRVLTALLTENRDRAAAGELHAARDAIQSIQRLSSPHELARIRRAQRKNLNRRRTIFGRLSLSRDATGPPS